MLDPKTKVRILRFLEDDLERLMDFAVFCRVLRRREATQ